MTYSETDDLLHGSIPIPAQLDPQRYVQIASDEMDSIIGFRYSTPVDMTDAGPVIRPARLLLKKIGTFLSTGRLLLAAGAGGEDKSLHAYAKSLVDQALYCLKEIADGEIILVGAVPPEGVTPIQSGPLIFNEDATSRVKDFYDEHPEILDPNVSTPTFPVWPGVLL